MTMETPESPLVEIYARWHREIQRYPWLRNTRVLLARHATTRKALFRGISPPGAVLAVKRLAGAGESDPRRYPPEERARRISRGPSTGGAAHGAQVHEEIEAFVAALWRSRPQSKLPLLETRAAVRMIVELARHELLPLLSEFHIGGVAPATRTKWGTRVDLVCMEYRIGVGTARPAMFTFVELKSGRENEIYPFMPADSPVDRADRFPGARKNPIDRDHLQTCATAAFADLPFRNAPSFVAHISELWPRVQLQHALLRVSRDVRFGLVHEPWRRAMRTAVLGGHQALQPSLAASEATASAAAAAAAPPAPIDLTADEDDDEDSSHETGESDDIDANENENEDDYEIEL